VLYTAVVVNGIGQPFSESSLNGLISKNVAPEIQGQVQGSVRATFALGRIVGPLWASWLYRAVSPATPYWVCVAQMLIAGLAVFLAMPKLRVAERSLRQTKV
jgi:DHA1 family tetracycline resistance protein-like MFS transporter